MSDSSDSDDAPPASKPEQKASSSSDSESNSEPENRVSSPKENVTQDKAESSDDDSDDGNPHSFGIPSIICGTKFCGQEIIMLQEMNRMKMQRKAKRTKRTLTMLRIEQTIPRRRAPLLTHISKFSATPVELK